MNPTKIPLRYSVVTRLLTVASALLSLTLSLTTARAHWPNGNATKWVQLPDATSFGLDVMASQPLVLADDFLCTNTGPVLDIHLWTSWLGDLPETNTTTITLAIWSDVPAGTTPSHPGSPLWTQTFGPGQYELGPILTAQEQFWNPDPPPLGTFMGPDTVIWQYNFYPADPFVQQGTLTNPRVYWLSVTANPAGMPFGWKTSTNRWNDAAVFAHATQGDWQPMFDPRTQIPLALAFALTTTNPIVLPPPPVETNTVKFVQYPNVFNGFDVLDTFAVMLADDFLCTNTGPVTDIHFWCSWLDDEIDTNASVWVGIFSDVPAGAQPSHPGALLWNQWFAPNQYLRYFWSNSTSELFYNPEAMAIMGPDTKVLYYSFYPTNPFVQQGSLQLPTIYWLGAWVTPPAAHPAMPFGWKTSLTHFMDNAVWGHWTNAPAQDWQELIDINGISLDLAFEITTKTNPCPQPPPLPGPPPAETNTVKFQMLPNFTGYDVLASRGLALADDFLCTNTGPITDIHLWCSWLSDRWATNIPLWLGIYSDVPADPTTPSHPGDLLWSQTFAPGQYQPYVSGTGTERFYDPSSGGFMGADTVAFYYLFYPTNPFVQQGTFSRPTIYWLAVSAPFTNACNLFGWKNSTAAFNDAAVWGHWGQGLPVDDWQSLKDPVGMPVDLAFRLTTRMIPTPPVYTNKWAQLPDLSTNGLDVRLTRPKILADDFLCTNSGPVTNIQLWCSWLNDVIDPNMRFQLAFWSDVRASATNASHPGRLLWQQWFNPGTYQSALDFTADEKFYDPNITGTNGLIGADHKVMLYTFYPGNSFWQTGSPTNPTVYWLSVQAIPRLSTRMVGWKTSTNHWNDDAVYGHVNLFGVPFNDWKELRDPRSNLSLDLAFRLWCGPASSTNTPPPGTTDPNITVKLMQGADLTTNGLDVLATAPTMLADDFRCTLPRTISGVTLWCSWLNDQVDPNAVFYLNLFGDVPAGSQPSHPGGRLADMVFYPPQSLDSTLARYAYRPAVRNLQEQFLNPTNATLMGADTVLWQYDFYPRTWQQRGSPTYPLTYWLGITAKTTNTFGWKTTTNHYSDDAVFGSVNANFVPLNNWQELRYPAGLSRELAFAVKTFTIAGCNKDLRNVTGLTADAIEIGLVGIHEIVWRWDDFPAWPNFQVTYTGGNTILRWSGKQVFNNAITHVGFEVPGPRVDIASIKWYAAGVPIGSPGQGNVHMHGNGVRFLNNVVDPPELYVANAVLEYHTNAVGLDQLNPGVADRHPIVSYPLSVPLVPIPFGGDMDVPIPLPPDGATYAVLVFDLMTTPTGTMETRDFIQVPLDIVSAPIITDYAVWEEGASLSWLATPGRTYRLQAKATLEIAGGWTDLGDVVADSCAPTALVPLGGTQQFYRVALLPETP